MQVENCHSQKLKTCKIYGQVCLAPGTYHPEKTRLDSTPQFTFGLRTSLDKPSDTPGNTERVEI